MDKNYYVYEWIRLDTNESIYIGKGKGNRAYEMKHGRNKYFKDVIKNRNVAVVILIDKLSEKEACQYECWYINELKYIFGLPLTNQTDGGDGVSGWFNNLDVNRKEEYSKNMTMILNERYKNNPEMKKKISETSKVIWNSSEMIEFAKERGKKRHEENPNFFSIISARYWRSDEGRAKASVQAKNIWSNQQIRNKILKSRKESEKVKENIRLMPDKYSGGGNPNAKIVSLNINGEIHDFSCKKVCIEYLNSINIQLISDRTGKPVKKVTKGLFKKKISSSVYEDYSGNKIFIVDKF